MSIIGDLFRGNRGTPVAPPAPPVVHNQPMGNPADGNKQMNPASPNALPVPSNGTANPNVDPSPISSLEPFKDLWKTPTTADGKPKPDPFAQPLLNNDPVKFAEATKQLNFAGSIPDDLVKKALAGDIGSLKEAINLAAQTAFQASSQLNTSLIESASQTNNKRVDSVLENKFREFLVKQERSDNPVLNHSSAAPMLDLAKRQLLSQHPDKSPTEIHKMAEQYLTSFASSITGEAQAREATVNGAKPDPFDFSNFG